MPQQNLFTKQTLKLAGGTISSVLLGFSIAPAASAQTRPVLNPCPGIYYEEPFNSVYAAPEGCPPNAATQGLTGQEQVPVRTPVYPPVTEDADNPIATITPTDGTVGVRLQNNTNAIITYQAVGYTERQVLQGGEAAVLQGLPTPVTIRMTRQDDGFIEAKPVSTQTGLLEIALDETTSLEQSDRTLRIQEDGQVFTN